MAVFVFFAATAGAEIVAAYAGRRLCWLFTAGVAMLAGDCGTLRSFAGIAFLGCCVARVVPVAFGCSLFDFRLSGHFGLCLLLPLLVSGRALRLLNEDATSHKCRQSLGIKGVEHLLKEVERFYLIDYEGILLFVACVLNRLAELIEFAEVLFPELVDGDEEH